MRKILNIMAIALAIFCRIPVEVHGQSFLKKLKQKVGNVVGTKDDTAEIGEEPFVGGDGDQPTRSVTPTDKLQKRRTATATWDEMIAPSRANSPEALLNELPPLPSVESIVYPEETARATYYRKIVAVDMRITELDSIHTCSDEEMIALRDKFYVELADINGITVEEMKSLEDPNLPEAEKERLIEKMKNALVGDTRGLEAMGADLEKREAAKGGKLTNEEKMAFLAEKPRQPERPRFHDGKNAGDERENDSLQRQVRQAGTNDRAANREDEKDTTGERWRDHELREDRRGIRIGIKDPLCPDL